VQWREEGACAYADQGIYTYVHLAMHQYLHLYYTHLLQVPLLSNGLTPPRNADTPAIYTYIYLSIYYRRR